MTIESAYSSIYSESACGLLPSTHLDPAHIVLLQVKVSPLIGLELKYLWYSALSYIFIPFLYCVYKL